VDGWARVVDDLAMSAVVSDMDGTLATVETWRGVQAWIADNHPSAAARRFVMSQLPSVVLAKAGLIDKEAFRARWLEKHARLLSGVTEADLIVMGDWVVEHHLWPQRRRPAIEALQAAARVARAQDPSARVVLASGGYTQVTDAFARRLGADIAVGTPLEIERGLATGRLAGPVQTGQLKARAVLDRIGDGRILVAFGDTAADIPMLELAERPVAVAPDSRLRRVALERGWELLDAG
jgi:phosphoserine phosphatase